MSRLRAVWRLLGVGDEKARQGPFVGRRAELNQFASLLEAAAEDKAGYVLQLRGEAGIGKTGLCEEFERMARVVGLSCHRGLVLDFGMETGRDAVRTIIRDLLGVSGQAPRESRRQVVREAMERGVLAAAFTGFGCHGRGGGRESRAARHHLTDRRRCRHLWTGGIGKAC